VLAALAGADAIVIAPSNPLVSVGPILAVPGVRRALARRRRRTVAISPLVGGRPVKGPLHRMLRGLGLPVSPVGVAGLYRGLADTFVLDQADARWAPRVAALGLRPVVADTLMRSPAQAARLARVALRAVDARP
jgi:LPPG:FO 2-phospho-L-lactate transferase